MPVRPLGNPLIPYDTPLHVTELILQILKITFEDLPEDYPYRFVRDDFDSSGIAFDVALNKDSEVYGRKPLVVVSRGTQGAGPTIVGDLAHVDLPTHLKAGSNLVTSSVNIQVISKTKAEVEIISQHIFSLLLMCRTHMPRLLGIHMANSISLSEVSKMEDDDTIFHTQMVLDYSIQYKWTQETKNEVLKSIATHISGSHQVY